MIALKAITLVIAVLLAGVIAATGSIELLTRGVFPLPL